MNDNKCASEFIKYKLLLLQSLGRLSRIDYRPDCVGQSRLEQSTASTGRLIVRHGNEAFFMNEIVKSSDSAMLPAEQYLLKGQRYPLCCQTIKAGSLPSTDSNASVTYS
jgi:hypothetical protein